jgi:hypothetical protein
MSLGAGSQFYGTIITPAAIAIAAGARSRLQPPLQLSFSTFSSSVLDTFSHHAL